MKKTIYSIFIITGILSVFAANSNAQTISTVAGDGSTGFGSDGVQATSTSLYYPDAVAFDNAGNLYITDNFNNRIRMVNSSGIISTIAGNGTKGGTGDGGPATAAELAIPVGIAFDNKGNLYIADRGNNEVRKINASGTITTVAGNGTAGYTGDGAAATAAELYEPYAVAVDTAGNVYIADDFNNCIRMVNKSGIISTVTGNGTGASTGDGGPATAAEINLPSDIVFDSKGNLFIAEGGGDRIRMIDISTGIISTVVGNGTASSTGDGGPATAATINAPAGVYVDSWGDIFIGESAGQYIRKVDPTGTITTIGGDGTGGFSGDGGTATSAEIQNPYGMAMDKFGNLYFADEFNHRVRKLVGGTLGLSTLSDSKGVSVYPNPTNQNLYVNVGNIQGKISYCLYNTIGQLVASTESEKQNIVTISVASLPAGVYILKMQSADYSLTAIKQVEIIK